MSNSDRWTLPLDAIFTADPLNPLAAMAYKIGFKIGANSKMRSLTTKPERWNWQYDITFLDCDYKKYDHERHLAVCRAIGPKYVTVRDIMSEGQCQKAGIAYFEFTQVMEFAQELDSCAGQVILIPKVECLDDIPGTYVLGYSIPTKYGGTPLPREMFKGRKVHLLGGSWKKQREYIQFFDGDVISFDNNYEWKVSVHGNFCLPDGTMHNLKDYGLDQVSSPMYAAMMLSLCNIATGLKDMFCESIPEKRELQNQLAMW